MGGTYLKQGSEHVTVKSKKKLTDLPDALLKYSIGDYLTLQA
mgnify:CR=1 FL=1